MRSIWKGSITFSLVSIPIKVFNAIETSEKISFNQLHAGDCLGPIGQKKQCKKCDTSVTNDEIVKGYQHEKDKYVVVAPEEIASITPESNEAIEIIGFIKPEEIPTAYFDASYFAAPNGPAAERSYALLREVMKRSRKVGIAKVILREREDLITILPQRRWPDAPKATLQPRGSQRGRCSGIFQSNHAPRPNCNWPPRSSSRWSPRLTKSTLRTTFTLP